MEVIAVTGTPGTGKTALSKKLAKKLDFYYIDVNNLIAKNKLYEGYDKKRKTKIVDVKKLNGKLMEEINFLKKFNLLNRTLLSTARSAKNINKIKTITNKSLKNKPLNQKSNKKTRFGNELKKSRGIIIDSHLSHYLPRKYVDLCIVTKCDIKELNKRLKNKKFSKSKTNENLQAEIFDICYNEAIGRKHKVIAVDTTKGFNMNKILRQLGD